MKKRVIPKILSARKWSLAFPLATLLAFLGTPSLVGQVVPPPISQARPSEETDIYLVTFQQSTSVSERAAIVQGAGAVLRISYNNVNAVSVQVPNVGILTSLRNDPRVVAVFANRSVFLHALQKPDAAGGKGGGAGGGSGGGGGGGKPTAPTNLAATTISSSQIDLTWTDSSSNESGFTIERCTGSGCGNFSQIGQVGANITNYHNLLLPANTTFRYRVRAFNATGNSKYSNISEATTDPESQSGPPSSAPSNLTLQVVSHRQINLAWQDNSDNEDGFRMERCSGTVLACTDANFLQIMQVGPNVTTYNDTGLSAETMYTYRIRAFNSLGNSPYSTPAEATTLLAPPSSQVVPSGVQRIGAAPGRLNWTGQGVGVAVVDTGIDFNHQDLNPAEQPLGSASFNAFGGSCQDIYGHGTHVAGIIAARNNTIDVVGVAPDATVYCVNVFKLDPIYGVVATDESLMAGLDWITTNANQVQPPIRVVNMSLGRERTTDDNDPNHPLHLSVKALYDSGVSVVVSAGNDPLREASQEVPASYSEVMAVASTTAVDGVNGYDEFYGPCPGYQNIKADTASYFTTDGAWIGGTGVTVSAPGEEREDIFDYFGVCYLEPIGILSTAQDGGTIELYGTSMSAPHVAGVVALMWEKELSQGRSLTPEQARTRIRNNVDRFGTAPLDAPVLEYSFDGEREGVVWDLPPWEISHLHPRISLPPFPS